jgi:uncharacterized protein YaaQ
MSPTNRVNQLAQDNSHSPTYQVNQLVILIVFGPQADQFMKRLTKNRFYFTKIDSSGGIVQEPMVCLLVGLNSARLGTLLELSRKYCKPYRQYIPTNLNVQPGLSEFPMIEAQMGGATVCVLNVERFEQL